MLEWIKKNKPCQVPGEKKLEKGGSISKVSGTHTDASDSKIFGKNTTPIEKFVHAR